MLRSKFHELHVQPPDESSSENVPGEGTLGERGHDLVASFGESDPRQVAWCHMSEQFPALPVPQPSVVVPGGLQWHHGRLALAALRKDGSVNVYDVSAKKWLDLTLFCEGQEASSCFAWRPNAGLSLAVGGPRGVALWSLRYGVGCSYWLDAANTTSCSWLTMPAGSPSSSAVSCLAWSPCGRFLAVGSIGSRSVVVWDVATATPVELPRGPANLLRWSPRGDFLLVSSALGKTMPVLLRPRQNWSAAHWELTSLTVVQVRCLRDAVWSPDGNYLALVFDGSDTIHVLETLDGVSVKHYVSESFAPYTSRTRSGTKDVCGKIDALSWNGQRLLVQFDSHSRELLALAATRTSNPQKPSQKLFQTSPIGFIREANGRVPVCSAFASDWPQGSLLAVYWDCGQISFYPLLHDPSQ